MSLTESAIMLFNLKLLLGGLKSRGNVGHFLDAFYKTRPLAKKLSLQAEGLIVW